MLFMRLFHKILFNFQKIKLKIPDPLLPVSQKALLQEDASTRGVPESRWREALTEGRGRRGTRRGRVTRLSPPVEAEHRPARRQKSQVHAGACGGLAKPFFSASSLSTLLPPGRRSEPDSSF